MEFFHLSLRFHAIQSSELSECGGRFCESFFFFAGNRVELWQGAPKHTEGVIYRLQRMANLYLVKGIKHCCLVISA